MLQRKSLRLKGYDYSQNGYYFVTICTQDRHNHFGEIKNDRVMLNDLGHSVENVWRELEQHCHNCRLDKHIVMPNHVHGIVQIDNVGAGFPGPLSRSPGPYASQEGGGTPPLRLGTLSNMMGYFKYQSTKRINNIRNSPGLIVWQRGFHEHIIRDEKDLNRIRAYIADNPKNWAQDENNSRRIRQCVGQSPTERNPCQKSS